MQNTALPLRVPKLHKRFFEPEPRLGRTPPTTDCLVIRALAFARSGSAHSLLFIHMLARNVIPPHLMRANFPLVSALGVFHALHHLGLERVSFLEQLVHTFRVGSLN